jgi:hypothetical protein
VIEFRRKSAPASDSEGNKKLHDLLIMGSGDYIFGQKFISNKALSVSPSFQTA